MIGHMRLILLATAAFGCSLIQRLLAIAMSASSTSRRLRSAACQAALFPLCRPEFPDRDPCLAIRIFTPTISFDAGMVGATLGPNDAYRFAKGNEVTSSTGQQVKLSRPLDFLVVADHSDNLGWSADFQRGKPELLADPTVRQLVRDVPERQGHGGFPLICWPYLTTGNASGSADLQIRTVRSIASAWQEDIAAARCNNEPGRFTAFIGYEWTSNTNGNNLHRNVIFRDNGDKASQVVPFDTVKPLGSDNPRDLWKWMANLREEDRRPTSSPLPTTAISPTACMFP